MRDRAAWVVPALAMRAAMDLDIRPLRRMPRYALCLVRTTYPYLPPLAETTV